MKEENNKEYIPNTIEIEERMFNIFASIIILTLSIIGLYNNSFPIIIPGRRGRGINLMLHSEPLWIFCIVLLCAILFLLSTVADHMDKRDNERKYAQFANLMKKLMWLFLVISLLAEWFIFKKSTPLW
ncbi:MAG: hypothetical protein IPK88_03435 [Saprospiraceae bacterium]|nr:hypothetical protein [Candidatus Defluviibacterium haderslevense]